MQTPRLMKLVWSMAGWIHHHPVTLLVEPVAQFMTDGRSTGEAPNQFTYTVSIEICGTKTYAHGRSRKGIDEALLELARKICEVHAEGQRYHNSREVNARNLLNEYIAESKD